MRGVPEKEEPQMSTRKRVAAPIVTMLTCTMSKVARYTGKLRPRCNGGRGCQRCWHKWHIVQNRAGHDDRPRDAEGSTP